MPIGSRREAFAVYMFVVEIKNQRFAYFRSVSGLKSEAEVVSVQQGGVNGYENKLIGRTKHPQLVLKQGFANPNMFRKREYFTTSDTAKIKRFSGAIIQLGPGGKEVHKWQFENAWISKWEGPEFDANKNEISIETIEIAHEGLKLVGSGGGGGGGSAGGGGAGGSGGSSSLISSLNKAAKQAGRAARRAAASAAGTAGGAEAAASAVGGAAKGGAKSAADTVNAATKAAKTATDTASKAGNAAKDTLSQANKALDSVEKGIAKATGGAVKTDLSLDASGAHAKVDASVKQKVGGATVGGDFHADASAGKGGVQANASGGGKVTDSKSGAGVGATVDKSGVHTEAIKPNPQAAKDAATAPASAQPTQSVASSAPSAAAPPPAPPGPAASTPTQAPAPAMASTPPPAPPAPAASTAPVAAAPPPAPPAPASSGPSDGARTTVEKSTNDDGDLVVNLGTGRK